MLTFPLDLLSNPCQPRNEVQSYENTPHAFKKEEYFVILLPDCKPSELHQASCMGCNWFTPKLNTIMGKAIVKCSIATYAEDEYVVEVPCTPDDIDEVIIARAWKKLKEEEQALPYGNRTAVILKRIED